MSFCFCFNLDNWIKKWLKLINWIKKFIKKDLILFLYQLSSVVTPLVFQCLVKCLLNENVLIVIRFLRIEAKLKRKYYQIFFIPVGCMSGSSMSRRWSLTNVPITKFNLSETFRLQTYQKGNFDASVFLQILRSFLE